MIEWNYGRCKAFITIAEPNQQLPLIVTTFSSLQILQLNPWTTKKTKCTDVAGYLLNTIHKNIRSFLTEVADIEWCGYVQKGEKVEEKHCPDIQRKFLNQTPNAWSARALLLRHQIMVLMSGKALPEVRFTSITGRKQPSRRMRADLIWATSSLYTQ